MFLAIEEFHETRFIVLANPCSRGVTLRRGSDPRTSTASPAFWDKPRFKGLFLGKAPRDTINMEQRRRESGREELRIYSSKSLRERREEDVWFSSAACCSPLVFLAFPQILVFLSWCSYLLAL
jgi:hypothetical protein